VDPCSILIPIVFVTECASFTNKLRFCTSPVFQLMCPRPTGELMFFIVLLVRFGLYMAVEDKKKSNGDNNLEIEGVILKI
jgi:hypothetical protein